MMNEFDFGILQPWIDDANVTDINYNGKQCWIDHLKKGRYRIENFEGHEFIQTLVYKIANHVNLPFNTSSPVIESETDHLRISILHPSIARGGISLSIRKTPSFCRLHDPQNGIDSYAPKTMIHRLNQAVKDHKNIMISGLPGSGKTELVKYLMESIPPFERVITIEDTLELRYGEMYPTKDHVMLKVKDHFDYAMAIKTSLRQRPDWICISEVRGQEIIHLLQSVSTGTKLISTIHAESAKAIPFRMMAMMPGSEITNQNLKTLIHDTLDMGIHLEMVSTAQGIVRRIREIVMFGLDEHHQSIQEVIYEAPHASPKTNAKATQIKS